MITGEGGVFIVGANHSLTCTASGGASMTYTYQWLRYDGDIVNETSSTISFFPLREADIGRYNCRVSNGSLNNISDDVVINVEGEYITMIIIILRILYRTILSYSSSTIS